MAMLEHKQPGGLFDRDVWLINLRWVASAGVLCTIFIVDTFLSVSFSVVPLYSIALCLIIYNLLLFFAVFHLQHTLSLIPSAAKVLANVQIAIDLTCLAALIYFSGGIENPFIYYFIFHVIIAGILLSRRAAFLQATYAVVLFLSIVFLEHSQVLSHYCLKGILPFCLNDARVYLLGTSVAFISTLYISVYLATAIAKQLREHEQSLEQANRLLNEQDQVKSKYVLRVTHDIKEDLAAIYSCVEPVAGGLLGAVSKEQDNMLQRVKLRSGRLIVYVNALLEITKLKLTKELNMEYFDFDSLIAELTEHVRSRILHEDLEFITDIEPNIGRVKGVRIYLHEVIWNLLINAIKYTPTGGKIELRVQKGGGSIFICIKDTGIGIPEAELPKVFEEFYRATNARTRERQGTGLGLSMAKEIIERHSGQIWIESVEYKGTQVFIQLPLVP